MNERTNGGTNGQRDICNYRVAFTTENHKRGHRQTKTNCQADQRTNIELYVDSFRYYRTHT